jgi:pyruvate kinase
MIRAGMDVARLNFSHGSHEQHAEVIANLRALSRRIGKPVAILQDLSGPKVRLGVFDSEGIQLKRGQMVGFRCLPEVASDSLQSDCPVLPLPMQPLLDALRPDHTLLLDDGKIGLKVTRCEGESGTPERTVWARCTVGGELKPRKGVTARGVWFDVAAVTEKDIADLRFGLAQGVDWVAVSYLRQADDLVPLRAVMQEVGSDVPIIAKIEKAEAVKNLRSILAVVQGVMVARGDMGVEMDFDEVPVVQKHVIQECNRAALPVITATQMLESMIQNPRPTRAEAADVFNAILDGTDAVMLSGETAAGDFPVEAVRTMHRIALKAEQALFAVPNYEGRMLPPRGVSEAVARATFFMAEQLRARAILCATTSGGTARQVAVFRPEMPILGVTTSEATYYRLSLVWGVRPVLIGQISDTDALMRATIEAALRVKAVRPGDRVVLTAGVPVNSPGTTNLIEVLTVGQSLYPKTLPSMP